MGDGRRTERKHFARHPIIGGVKDERRGSRSVRRRARSERRATGIVAAPFPRKIPRAGGRGRKGAQLMMTRGGTRAEPGPGPAARFGSPTARRRRHTTECWCTGGRLLMTALAILPARDNDSPISLRFDPRRMFILRVQSAGLLGRKRPRRMLRDLLRAATRIYKMSTLIL